MVQEFILGMFDPDATADFNQNQSDFSIVKDPRSKDASQRYSFFMAIGNTVLGFDSTNRSRIGAQLLVNDCL